jgi:hypothetical protein
MNPCPCGYHGDAQRKCACPPLAVQRYLSRVSGPLLDRIDLHVEVPAVRYRELSDGRSGEPSAAIRERVLRARDLQRERFADRVGTYANAHMGARDIREFCRIDDAGDALLRTAVARLGFSARAYHRILKIARTLADLEAAPEIGTRRTSQRRSSTARWTGFSGGEANLISGRARARRSRRWRFTIDDSICSAYVADSGAARLAAATGGTGAVRSALPRPHARRGTTNAADLPASRRRARMLGVTGT